MTPRCPACGCRVERLSEDGSAAETIEREVGFDSTVSLFIVLAEFVRRWWPWSRRPYWCPRCKKVVTC